MSIFKNYKNRILDILYKKGKARIEVINKYYHKTPDDIIELHRLSFGEPVVQCIYNDNKSSSMIGIDSLSRELIIESILFKDIEHFDKNVYTLTDDFIVGTKIMYTLGTDGNLFISEPVTHFTSIDDAKSFKLKGKYIYIYDISGNELSEW